MSDTIQPSSPIVSAAPSLRQRRLLGILVPFVPVVLALAVAFIARNYQKSSPRPMAPAAPVIEGMPAPDFALQDGHKGDNDAPVKLSDLAKKSPVLLVFHRGFDSCSRCFRLLLWLAELNGDFQKQHVQIVAIAPWTTEHTREAVENYGDFPFPLLADAEGDVARTYGLEDVDGNLLYGLFLVDSQQKIVFAQRTLDASEVDPMQVLEIARTLPPNNGIMNHKDQPAATGK
jgi:peroxiredoxin